LPTSTATFSKLGTAHAGLGRFWPGLGLAHHRCQVPASTSIGAHCGRRLLELIGRGNSMPRWGTTLRMASFSSGAHPDVDPPAGRFSARTSVRHEVCSTTSSSRLQPRPTADGLCGSATVPPWGAARARGGELRLDPTGNGSVVFELGAGRAERSLPSSRRSPSANRRAQITMGSRSPPPIWRPSREPLASRASI